MFCCPFQKNVRSNWVFGHVLGVVSKNKWALSWAYRPIKLKLGLNVKSTGACAKLERIMYRAVSTAEAWGIQARIRIRVSDGTISISSFCCWFCLSLKMSSMWNQQTTPFLHKASYMILNREEASASLEWKCSQAFGERNPDEELQDGQCFNFLFMFWQLLSV